MLEVRVRRAYTPDATYYYAQFRRRWWHYWKTLGMSNSAHYIYETSGEADDHSNSHPTLEPVVEAAAKWREGQLVRDVKAAEMRARLATPHVTVWREP